MAKYQINNTIYSMVQWGKTTGIDLERKPHGVPVFTLDTVVFAKKR